MIRAFFILFSLFATLVSLQAQSVGLVLSGGGAKGIAHIGMIQALEENDIPIDYIAGTSMGAIVGSMYAMGYTPAQMIEFLKSDDFLMWKKGRIDEKYLYYFKKKEPTPEIVSFKIGLNDTIKNPVSQFLPKSLINPLPMNFAFMRLYAPYNAQSKRDFDKLFVPFRAVSSDVYRKKAVVFSKGDLGDAVRTSMSFPLVFAPIEVDGSLLWDGGIFNNFPVDVMKNDFNPDIILGSVVTGNPVKAGVDDIVLQVENMIMHQTDYTLDPQDGILLDFKLNQVGLLDFDKLDVVFNIGYQGTMEMMDSIKMRIKRRETREQRAVKRLNFTSKTPLLLFDSVAVDPGVSSLQAKYLKKQFQATAQDSVMDEDHVTRAYYKLLSDTKITDIMPHASFDESNSRFTLHLKAKMDNRIDVGLGGFISSSNANQFYISAKYTTLGALATDIDAGFNIGQSYYSAMLSGRIDLPTHIPTYLRLFAVASRKTYFESDKLFYEEYSPAFITMDEYFAKLRIGLPFLNNSKTEVSMGMGRLRDQYYQVNNIDFSSIKSDQSIYDLAMASLRFESSTLNAPLYPTTGSSTSLTGIGVIAKENYTMGKRNNEAQVASENTTHSWLTLSTYGSNYLRINSKFTVGIYRELVLSSKGFFNNYTSTLLQATAFCPTPHSKIVFNEAFRANQFVAVGVLPIVTFTDNLSWRNELYGFLPVLPIRRDKNDKAYYGKPFSRLDYQFESSLVLNLPFGSAAIYVNNYSYPAKNWNFGVNLGILIYSPKLLGN